MGNKRLNFHFPTPEKEVFYRILQPFRYFKRRGLDARLFVNFQEKILGDGDTFVYYKFPNPFLEEIVAKINSAKKTLIYDLDEMLLALPPYHSAFQFFFGDTEPMRVLKRILRDVSIVTVPTSHMADIIRDYTSRVEVFPFFISESFLANKSSISKSKFGLPKESVVIGWIGNVDYVEELMLLKLPLEKIVMAHKNVYLFFFRVEPPFIEVSPEKKHVLVPDRFGDYLEFLDLVDIGIAPLTENLYNRCRFGVEILEFGSKKIPVIASKALPYLEIQKEGAPIFFAETHSEWEELLNELVICEEERVKIGKKLYDFVMNNYLLEKRMPAYERIFYDNSS